MWEAQ